jgi:hypothetical protein
MIEQLESAAEANSLDNDCPAVRYRIAKLYLALSACYLLAIGRYEPSYRERATRLQELAASDEAPPSPLPLQRFSDFVWWCTDLKLHGESIAPQDRFPRWRDAVSDAEILWRWILGRMLGMSPSLSRTDLVAAMAMRQPLRARAKGWLRAAYVSRARFGGLWFRWMNLARSGSPRYLVYGAASELFFSGSESDALTPHELAAIVARLPLPPPEANQQLSWRATARLVAHNFRVLLDSTRS